MSKEQIAQAFTELKAIYNRTPASERAYFGRQLADFKKSIAKTSTGRPPAQASIQDGSGTAKVAYPLWEDRPVKRGTSPAKWIQQYHSDLIGTPSARAAIGRRDPGLIQHYATWISPGRHPEDDLNLDTRLQTDLSDMSASEILDRKHRQVRESKRRAAALKM